MPDASWGYSASTGLRAVLGGEKAEEIDRSEGAMSPFEMRRYIESCPDIEQTEEVSEEAYDNAARRFAKTLLAIADEDPARFLLWTQDGQDFYQEAKQRDPHCDPMGITGFMYGWAVNAVRYIWSEHPVSNPAIVTIRNFEKGDSHA